MTIGIKDVEHVALLARLGLSEVEKTLFAEQLNTILEYAAVLERLDTAQVPPTSHVLPLQNVMRPDDSRPSLPREEALANAPDREEGFFKVPRIIE